METNYSSIETSNELKIDNLTLIYDSLKEEIHQFLSENPKKGYYFNIKLCEKENKIKIFLTLLKKTEINSKKEDINLLILLEENYPEKAPKIFFISNVKYLL